MKTQLNVYKATISTWLHIVTSKENWDDREMRLKRSENGSTIRNNWDKQKLFLFSF